MRKNYFVCSPQTFWLSSAPGALSTLVTSVVLFLLTQGTLMSPGQDKTRVCGYIYIYIYIYILHIFSVIYHSRFIYRADCIFKGALNKFLTSMKKPGSYTIFI